MPAFEPTQPARRCAIYTRKSVQQDPAHQFSSLEAQRSICFSYMPVVARRSGQREASCQRVTRC